MGVSGEELAAELRAALAAEYITIEDKSCGCGAAFECIIVSPQFEGLTHLQRQRKVFALIKSQMQQLHALQLQTFTPKEWQQKQHT